MSSKIATILSMIFVAIFFLLGIDLLSLKTMYSSLDSKAISISYHISKSGKLDAELVSYIENTYNVEFNCLTHCTPMFGDIVDYTISCEFNPLLISESTYVVAIKRQAIIGYYN